MIRSALGKVAWVGRTASMVFGLALVLAMVVGVATAALGANGGNFILGKTNVATLITRLSGPDGVNGAMFEVQNNNVDANDTALSLKVQAGESPMTVNSAKKVANLNADRIDDREASSFANAVHQHAGGQITSGTVADARVAGTVARDAEVPGIVTNNDGTGSGLDADKLDGKDAGEFLSHNGTAQDSQSLGGIPAHGYQQRIAWAAVFMNGTIQKGHGAVSATKTSTGQYNVTFAGSVPSHCATLATAHGASGTGYFTAYTNSDGTVSVNTRNTSSSLADNHFYLVVLC